VTVQPLPPKGHEAASKFVNASSSSRGTSGFLVTPRAIAELRSLEIPLTTALRTACETLEGSEKFARGKRPVNKGFSQQEVRPCASRG
jgi:hypothetical protein